MSIVTRVGFGPFVLDPHTGELWKRGVRRRIAPQPLRVLLLLIEARGALVDRDTLRRQLWGDHTTVDFEQGLNYCIRELRAVLQDNAKKPRYIETLPRRGYRFVAAVTEVAAAPAPQPAQEKPEPSDTLASSDENEIEAYQCYLEGKQKFAQFGKQSLEQAAECFRRALQLRPNYALAHAGLGAAYSLRTLNRRDPQDLEHALTHLRRALELDPIIAEPYPWLCYVYIRLGQLPEAIVAGHRAVELQPELVHGHYFLGCAYFTAGENDIGNYQHAADHLLRATQVEPRWQPSFFILSYIGLITGDRFHAERFARQLLAMSVHAPQPFIGAEIVLASVQMRHRNSHAARSLLVEFLERMQHTDHMYKDSMMAIASCLLGETELREGNAAEALTAFRRAWHVLQEHPRTLSHQRACARVQAGLAGAFALQGDAVQASEQLGKALALTAQSLTSVYAAAGANLAELYLSLATASQLTGDTAQAMTLLQASVDAGWLDADCLESDPCLLPLRSGPQFQALVQRIRQAPKIAYSAALAAYV